MAVVPVVPVYISNGPNALFTPSNLTIIVWLHPVIEYWLVTALRHPSASLTTIISKICAIIKN